MTNLEIINQAMAIVSLSILKSDKPNSSALVCYEDCQYFERKFLRDPSDWNARALIGRAIRAIEHQDGRLSNRYAKLKKLEEKIYFSS